MITKADVENSLQRARDEAIKAQDAVLASFKAGTQKIIVEPLLDDAIKYTYILASWERVIDRIEAGVDPVIAVLGREIRAPLQED